MEQNNYIENKHDNFHLARIVFSLSTIALLTKIFGFAEKLVIAHYFGTGDISDVYFTTTGIVLSIIWIVKELMYPSFLPVYVESLSKPDSFSGYLFSKVFLLAALFLAAASLIVMLFPGIITKILAPGFTGTKQLLTSNLLRVLSPAVFFTGLAMLTNITLNGRKLFLKAAFPEAALKLFIVIGLVALVPFISISALAIVMSLGGLGCLLAQLYFIPERKFLFKPVRDAINTDYFKKVLLLMSPLVVGVIFSHVSGLIDNLLASTLPEGHLSYLGYSKKLIDAILLIGPVAMITVIYSHLSHLAAAKEYEKFKILFINSLRILIYISVPIACLLIILRMPVVQFLFQRGQFSIESSNGTSMAFMIYCLGLTTLSLETLFVFTFFALSDTKTPVIFGIAGVILDIILAIALLKPLGHLGIAGAFIMSKTIKIIFLGTILNKKLNKYLNIQTAIFLLKMTPTTLAIGLITKLLLMMNNDSTKLNILIYDLMLPSLGALVTFIIFSHYFKIEEFKTAASLFRSRKAAVPVLYGETK